MDEFDRVNPFYDDDFKADAEPPPALPPPLPTGTPTRPPSPLASQEKEEAGLPPFKP